MIDSHSHTFYSKHATGTVDELVRASIAAGVTILTLTDHAPFPVDTDNRLLASELDRYFADIERARNSYQEQITILCGLELDYMPGTDAFNRELLTCYPMDFVIGSIHYVEVPDETMVKVWELPRLAGQAFLDRYFANLEGLLDSGLFDAVGHADTLLRGVPEDIFLRRFEPCWRRSPEAVLHSSSMPQVFESRVWILQRGGRFRAFGLIRLESWWLSLSRTKCPSRLGPIPMTRVTPVQALPSCSRPCSLWGCSALVTTRGADELMSPSTPWRYQVHQQL